MSILIAILSFVFVISPLVIIHEFGHYLVGKYLGARPTVFSLGMGKVLFSKNKWGTEWRFSLFPVGGYVMFDTAQFSFEKKERLPAWKWVLIALAGPLSNFLYTFVILFGVFFHIGGGINVYTEKSQKVMVLTEKAQGAFVKNIVAGHSGPENIFLINKKESTVTPLNEGQIKELGFNLSLLENKNGLSERVSFSIKTTGALFNFLFVGTVDGLSQIFKKKDGYKSVSGPVGIASEASEASQKGLLSILFFSALISFALGFMNLIPLLILDGGRVLMAVIECITRKEPSDKFLGIYSQVSFLAIGALLVIATYSDFSRFFK